jgi:hypothetical protein
LPRCRTIGYGAMQRSPAVDGVITDEAQRR